MGSASPSIMVCRTSPPVSLVGRNCHRAVFTVVIVCFGNPVAKLVSDCSFQVILVTARVVGPVLPLDVRVQNDSLRPVSVEAAEAA